MNKQPLADFRNPGSQYRGAPFWAWNGKLDSEELRRQIRVMNRMGLGGFFMHSRVGLDTAYLSKDWFECVKACVDEAEKLDMQAWLYDEDRWPSGAAGGLVTKNPKYRKRSLVMERVGRPASLEWDSHTVAAFTARVKGGVAADVRRLGRGRRPARLVKGQSLFRFYVKLDDLNSWYNGYTYLDTLNREAVRRFIAITHEAYRKHVGRHFGKRTPGIFTDEPQYGRVLEEKGRHRVSIPWTDKLPAVFKRRYGYDILNRLLEIYFDLAGQEMSQARYHYYDCVTHLFVDAFARQIGDWCDKNKMQHTGHVLGEETPASQTRVVGNAMRFYEYMQAPGMDVLTEHKREYDTAKQVSSVARQFGRKWRITETYGCTGWDFPFAGHKAIGDWQVALGINLRCQHLSWYTMTGQAKRDYPAGIFHQSPWWELYPKVEDYFARVHLVMTQGAEVRDLLVIHPIESMWTLFNKGRKTDPRVWACDSMLAALRDSLLAQNIDFDYGDEDILARHGKVVRTSGEPILRVRKAEYKAVLVPPLRTMRRTTLDLLKRFRRAGGTVVFAGPPPTHINALPCADAVEFARTCASAPAKGKKLADAVEAKARRVSIMDEKGRQIAPALHLLREDKDAYYLFVCNTGHKPGRLKPVIEDPSMARDRKEAFPCALISGFDACQGPPIELDPETGEIFSADARRRKDKLEIRASLAPLGSRLFVIPKKKSRMAAPKRKSLTDARRTILAPVKWDIALSESNCLVLDRPQYKIGSGRRQKAEEILRVDIVVRDALGMPRRGGQMVQPWARKRSAKPKRTSVILDYEFEVAAVPSGDLFLAIERPDTFRVRLNGAPVSLDVECGWWCDRSLRKLPIDPASLHVGKNRITLTCDYDENHPGLEIIYLLGNFGTRVEQTRVTLTHAPTTLRIGDWVKQGLAFYSGSVSYCRAIRPKLKKNERLFVETPEYRGVAVRVVVDGKTAGVIAWEPNEADITDFVCGNGEPADLRIEVVGSRRNSHGPLHHAEKWPFWTGPAEFVTSGKKWIDAYNLVPCGLMKPPRLIVRR